LTARSTAVAWSVPAAAGEAPDHVAGEAVPLEAVDALGGHLCGGGLAAQTDVTRDAHGHAVLERHQRHVVVPVGTGQQSQVASVQTWLGPVVARAPRLGAESGVHLLEEVCVRLAEVTDLEPRPAG
jgi:hypothetical protein